MRQRTRTVRLYQTNEAPQESTGFPVCQGRKGRSAAAAGVPLRPLMSVRSLGVNDIKLSTAGFGLERVRKRTLLRAAIRAEARIWRDLAGHPAVARNNR